jgi:hypothetical protein
MQTFCYPWTIRSILLVQSKKESNTDAITTQWRHAINLFSNTSIYLPFFKVYTKVMLRTLLYLFQLGLQLFNLTGSLLRFCIPILLFFIMNYFYNWYLYLYYNGKELQKHYHQFRASISSHFRASRDI